MSGIDAVKIPPFGDGPSKSSPFEGLIVPIDKPAGITSFGVVRRIRGATGVKRVGHAGTLDPFAEGVLVVGIGRSATRRLGEYLRQEKEYVGRVVLGVVTDTYDPTGKVVENNPYAPPDERRVCEVLRGFRGMIEQIPPLYSAVKVGGQRLYKAARKGLAVEREPRRVEVKRIELVQMRKDGFDIRVVCSHGTYIRTLAYDIGRALGCGAHLGKLVRTRVGRFTRERALNLNEFISEISQTGKGD